MKPTRFTRRPGPAAAFTMVEIALALAIIGFALVAIIKVLPIGLNTQRDNREETIINHDAAVWLDALSAGTLPASYAGELAFYVDSVTNVSVEYDTTQTPWRLVQTNTYGLGQPGSVPWPAAVGLLSTPRYDYWTKPKTVFSNTVTATVRAMTGPAVSRAPQANATILDGAFGYLLTADIVPAFDAPTQTTEPEASVQRNLQNNFHDVRLTFRWPLLPDGRPGPNRRTYRASVAGLLILATNAPSTWPPVWYFQPSTYAKP